MIKKLIDKFRAPNTTVLPKDSNSFRYERKFVIDGFHNNEPEHLIRLHPAMFREIYHQRNVNNIYLDTFKFKNYFENIAGNARRLKVRIRWYGELLGMVREPVLEFKVKKALLGRKESFKLKDFILDRNFNSERLQEVFLASGLPDEVMERIRGLNPTLLNRYTRKYFLSADKNYRVTIDRDLEYYSINNNNNKFNCKFRDPYVTIVELKYAADLDNTANEISTLFPFRMTKSSKYINGIDRFYGSTI